jgi:hypothetical protein
MLLLLTSSTLTLGLPSLRTYLHTYLPMRGNWFVRSPAGQARRARYLSESVVVRACVDPF